MNNINSSSPNQSNSSNNNNNNYIDNGENIEVNRSSV